MLKQTVRIKNSNKAGHAIKKGFLVFFYFLICVFYCFSGHVFAATLAGHVRQGNKFYAEGKYKDASEKYQDALKKSGESDIINFNAGAAYYQSGDFERAQGHFQKALLSADENLRQRAYYNLGNTFYRMAERIGPQSPQDAVPFLERSLAHYEQALALIADDEDAQYNYAFVKRVLEKVKEEVEKQKQQCNNSEKSEEPKGQASEEKESRGPQNGQDSSEGQGGTGEEEIQQGAEQAPSSEKDGDETAEQSAGANKGDPSGDDAQGGEESGNEKDLNTEEALMRLMEYQRNEESKGLLNLRGTFDARAVEKDW